MTYFGLSERGFKQFINIFFTRIVNKSNSMLNILTNDNICGQKLLHQAGRAERITITGLGATRYCEDPRPQGGASGWCRYNYSVGCPPRLENRASIRPARDRFESERFLRYNSYRSYPIDLIRLRSNVLRHGYGWTLLRLLEGNRRAQLPGPRNCRHCSLASDLGPEKGTEEK